MSHNNIETRIKRVQKQLDESYDLLKHHKERNVSSTAGEPLRNISSTVGEPSNIPQSPVADTITNVCYTGVVGETFVDDVFDQIKNCIIELDEEAGPDLVFDKNLKWHRPTRNILKDIPLGKHYRVYKPTKITKGFAEPPHGPKTKEYIGPPAARFELDPKPENPFIEIRMVSEPRGLEKRNTLIFSRAILPDTPAIGGDRPEYQTVYSFGLKFSNTPFKSNNDPANVNDPAAKAIAQAEELAAARASAAQENAKAVAAANAARLAAPASGNNSSSKKNGNNSAAAAGVVAAPVSGNSGAGASGNNSSSKKNGNKSAAAGNASVLAAPEAAPEAAALEAEPEAEAAPSGNNSSSKKNGNNSAAAAAAPVSGNSGAGVEAAPASGNNPSSKKNGNNSAAAAGVVAAPEAGVEAAPASGNNSSSKKNGNNSAAAGVGVVAAPEAAPSGNNSAASSASAPSISDSAGSNSPGGFAPAPAAGPINRRAQQNRWIRFAEGRQTQANINASPGYVKSQAAKINSNVAAAAAAKQAQNNLFAARSKSAAKAHTPMAFAQESRAPGINRVANSMRRNAERIRAARGKPQATGWWAPSKGRGGTRKLRRANRTRKVKQLRRRQ